MNLKNFNIRLGFFLLVSLFSANTLHAAPLFFDNGGINIVDTDVRPDFLIVDNSTSGDATTVVLANGAQVGTDTVIVDDTSVVVFGSSLVEINGGMIENDAHTYDIAALNMFGGEIGDDILAFDDSIVNVFGGLVGDDVEASDNSFVTLWGGAFNEDIEAFDIASILIFGGMFAADGLGRLDRGLAAFDDSTITLFGSDFYVNGTAYVGGLITELSGTISGVLQDGSNFFMPFMQDFAGQISIIETSVEVSEPSPALFAALSLFLLLISRKSIQSK